MKTLYLIDGNSLLYRAFYALPPFTTAAGLPTNAILGFARMLLKLIKEKKPDYLVVVFDAHGPTFRDEQFEHYKAHRPKAPDDLNAQRPYVHKLVQAMHLAFLQIEGVEADDVIGTLATQHASDDVHVYIVTGDKDLMQFVDDERVMLYDTMKDVVYDEKAVKEKMGVGPECIIDLLALMGDTSDNIPGVKGIGPKTAVKLLLEYGSFAKVMENAEEITGSVGEKLRADRAMAELSFFLSKIKTDVELDVELEDLQIRPPDVPALTELFRELEFKSLLKEIQAVNGIHPSLGEGGSLKPERSEGGGETDLSAGALAKAGGVLHQGISETRVFTIQTMEEVEGLWEKIKAKGSFAYVMEHTETHPMRARVDKLGISVDAGFTFVMNFTDPSVGGVPPTAPPEIPRSPEATTPLSKGEGGAKANLDKKKILSALRDLILDKHVTAIGHNVKLDLHALENELGPRAIPVKTVQQSLL